MPLTPFQQDIGIAILRISPVFIAAISGTFSYLAHEYVAGFKHKDVTYEGRSAVIPGWWDHIRAASIPIIWGTFSANFVLGVANAYNSTLWGLLGDGTKGAVGPLAARLYLVAGVVSMSYYVQTIVRQFIPLQFDVLMASKLAAAKREAGLDKFLRMDIVRAWTTSYPLCALFLAATTVWVAEQL